MGAAGAGAGGVGLGAAAVADGAVSLGVVVRAVAVAEAAGAGPVSRANQMTMPTSPSRTTPPASAKKTMVRDIAAERRADTTVGVGDAAE